MRCGRKVALVAAVFLLAATASGQEQEILGTLRLRYTSIPSSAQHLGFDVESPARCRAVQPRAVFALGGSLEVQELRLLFTDGASQAIAVGETISSEQRTRPLEVEAAHRAVAIQRVELTFRLTGANMAMVPVHCLP